MGFCLGLIYEPLWRMSEDGTISPVLAKGIVNRGSEVDISLTEGVKWHDGSEFIPEDVVYTISLITGGRSVYPKGIIENAWVSGKSRVTVKLKAPIFAPENLFTFPVIKNKAPLHTDEPVGTGMYKFAGKGGFDTYLFEPFKDRQLSTLRLIRVRDKTRETELFKSGITDIQFVENNHLQEYIPLVNSTEIKYPTNHMIYIGFNRHKLSPDFRRGVFYALDTKRISEEIYGRTAKATSVPYLSGDSFLYKHIPNLSLSRSELRAGGFSSHNGKLFRGNKPLMVRVGVAPGEGHHLVAEALAKTLAQMGADCVAEDLNPAFTEDYDIIVATENTSELLEQITGSSRCSDSEVGFNNAIFTDVPLIPVAFRCNAVYVSGVRKGEIGFPIPLFFW